MSSWADNEGRSERSDSGVLRHSTLTTFDFGIADSCDKIVVEGYLKRQFGGIFVKWRKSWAMLRSNGRLLLSKSRGADPFASINICEFQSFSAVEDDASVTFSTVIGGTIETLKFIVADAPLLKDWTVAFEQFVGCGSGNKSIVANDDAYVADGARPVQPPAVVEHQQDIVASKSDIYDDNDDQLYVDPTEKVQSGGEPVKKSGFIKKRGGAKGGNTAFKRRWFVLTQFGRVLYFRSPRSFQALGQFTVLKASLIKCAKFELKIITLTRTWELQFENNDDRNEWINCIEEVLCRDERDLELARSANTKAARRHSLLQSIPPSLYQRKSANMYCLSLDNACDAASIVARPPLGKWQEICVACVTWNLAESLPNIADLRFLKKLRECDVVTVGVQECQPVMYRNFASDELTPIDVWQAMVQTILGDSFTLVAARAMGAIHICVLAKNSLIDHIGDINTAHVSCGIGNVMYNKGAVGVSMKIYDTSIAFICAHLAANREKVAERNNDFQRIASQMADALKKTGVRSRRGTRHDEPITISETSHDFSYDISGDVRYQERRSTVVELSANPLLMDANTDAKKDGALRRQAESPDSGEYLAKCFDRCFFLGDLNYRLEAEKQWTQTLLAMRERMLLLDKEHIISSSEQFVGTPLSNQLSSVEHHNVDLCDIEEMNDPRENEVQMLLNMLPQINYGSDCDDDDCEEDTPDMDVVNLDKQSSIGDSVSCGTFDALNSDRGAVDDKPFTPDLVRRATSGEDGLDVVDLKDDSGLSVSRSDDMLRRATSDMSNLTIESDTINIVNELLRLSDDEDSFSLQHSHTDIVEGNNDDESRNDFSNPHIPFPKKILSDSAKHTLDFFVSQTGLDRPIKIIERLLCFDQLLNEKKRGAIFKGFDEGKISFKPSYKFDPYTETYDTGKKSRAPAWCDRVLYNIPRYEKELSVISYECEHGRYHSDHRAVIAKFIVKV